MSIKGDWDRTADKGKYDDNFDAIFGKGVKRSLDEVKHPLVILSVSGGVLSVDYKSKGVDIVVYEGDNEEVYTLKSDNTVGYTDNAEQSKLLKKALKELNS